jgi:hypothetical protein
MQTFIETIKPLNPVIRAELGSISVRMLEYRLLALETFLLTGTPLNKIDAFRPLLEMYGFRLTSASHFWKYIPALLEKARREVIASISGKPHAIAFDGTTVVSGTLSG